ncbi:cation:proton antiporter, partial [Saccharothrix sp. MB29]|nr:cation:proton antiporter [Saccharothrix sp. MB29]
MVVLTVAGLVHFRATGENDPRRVATGGRVGGVTGFLGVAAAVLLLSVIAVRVSIRLGLPSLLLYLGIGVLLGEAVVGIQFEDADLTRSLGTAALVLILTEGGLTTRWSAVKPALGLGIALSTVSVGVSIAVTGFALHFLLDMDWRTAL